jgi:YD repeat-containing protein
MRKSMTMPGGRQITYAYGPDNLVSSVSYARPGYPNDVISYSYDGLGYRDVVTYPGGLLSVDYDHDANGALLKASWNSDNRGFFAEQLDAAGRIARYTRRDYGTVDDIYVRYDNRGHMKQDGSTAYLYDEAGNRAVARAPGDSLIYEYVRPSDRLQRTVRRPAGGGTATYRNYRYDAAGWLMADSIPAGSGGPRTMPFVYYASGQLATHDPQGTTPQYRYDGVGRLIMRRQTDMLNVPSYYDGVNLSNHSGLDVVHMPGVDDPIVGFASSVWRCFYIASGGRQVGVVESDGTACNSSTLTNYGGSTAYSHSFGLTREPGGSSEFKVEFFRNRWYDARTGRHGGQDFRQLSARRRRRRCPRHS